MAIIRSNENFENNINCIATLAFFCGVSCVSIMLKFGGFKASMNLFNNKKNGKEKSEVHQGSYMTGAYRTNRDEITGIVSTPTPTKVLTPSMVKLPGRKPCLLTSRPTKSTGNLSLVTENTNTQLNQSTQNISSDPRGDDTQTTSKQQKQQERNRKRLEKQRLEEQKAIERTAAREQAKLEKLKKEKEKKQPKQNAIKDKKRKAPQPETAADLGHSSTQYSTNTLESSISRSTGPPPYTETKELVQNTNDPAGNTSFSKPIDTGSWEIISQHRQQLNRTTNTVEKHNKQTVIDLNYSVRSDDRANTDV